MYLLPSVSQDILPVFVSQSLRMTVCYLETHLFNINGFLISILIEMRTSYTSREEIIIKLKDYPIR